MKRDKATRLAIREWLQQILDETGMSAIKLAEISGTSANTIYRALDTESEFMSSTTTLTKIARATRRELPVALMFPDGNHPVVDHVRPVTGLSAIANPDNGLRLSAELHHQFWRVNDRALELEGYLPGDIIATDPQLMPVTGDIVCAQVTFPSTRETKLSCGSTKPHIF